MKRVLTIVALLVLTTVLLAQQNLVPICEVDYYNATRYSGARNSARSSNGDLIVVFEPGSDYTNMNIWYVTYNWIFGSWDPPVQLSQSTTNATGVPAVVADNTGKIYATWKEKKDNGKRDLMFSVWENGLWSTPVTADTIDNNTGVQTVNLNLDGSEIFSIFSIWNDPPVFDANIYVSHSADGGATWVTDNLTAVFPTPNYLPFNWMDVDIAPGPNGRMYAAWEDKPQPLTNQYEVLFSRYIPGSGWSTEPEILTPINDGDPSTARYVDGCTPVPGAVSVYEMGPSSYQFAGLSSVIYYDNGTSQTLSCFFNMYYQLPVSDRVAFTQDVLNALGITSSSDVLVVDDDNKWNNEYIITGALDSLGMPYSVFDCGDVGGMAAQKPTASDLNGRDLVIWFTGDDLNHLAFWNINDEDNPELINYLNLQGKKLWIIGRDWLYDRYGAAPDTFSTGDFVYDYLGISSYDVQSYRDDGNVGVSELDLVPGNGILSVVDPIGWGNAGTRQGEPSLASDPAGNLYMAYYDANGRHIMFQKYDGTNWTSPIQIDDTPDTVSVQRPNIAVDPNRGVYVVWMQQTGVDTSGYLLYNVWYATSPDGGTTWNPPQQLSNCNYVNGSGYSVKNPTIGRVVRPAMPTVGFEGGADVVWTEASPSSSMGYYLMYARIPYVGTVGIEPSPETTPYRFALLPNYPNPFNPATEIRFTIPRQEEVTLEVYDITGRRVTQLVHGKMKAGEHRVRWEARHQASGVYFAVLKAGEQMQVRKMMLVR